jgi:predicted dehydrogenase
MARHHLHNMLQMTASTAVTAICEPSAANYAAASQLFKEAGLPVPPNEPDWDRFLERFSGELDALFIITPHAYHHDQTKAALEAGLDVLLEKPMVINAAEARSLIETRDRTGRLLVVAFPGSLSPQIRAAVSMLQAGDLGLILNVSGTVWQDWQPATVNTWRQQPDLAGGGFLFDTGAHMLNTVSDLVGEGFAEVAAWMDNHGAPVDILAAVMGRTKSGAIVTINACGAAIPSCSSDIRVFCQRAILRTGIWGERLELQRAGERDLSPVAVPESMGVWEQFLAVRQGQIANPSPPEVGLRMALLWDAIRESASHNGVVVKIN